MFANTVPESEKHRLELVKLEYEQATQRYENVYRAIWQIFSYMAILTGAILTFGASQFPLTLVLIAGPLPLVFWFFAIFLPMDKYGQLTKKRLKDIENSINEDFFSSTSGSSNSNYKFNHYTEFSNSSESESSVDKLFARLTWRVNSTVKSFALIVVLLWVVAFIITLNNSSRINSKAMTIRLEPPLSSSTQDPEIQEVKQELENISQKLTSIENLLRQRVTVSPRQEADNLN
jgi:hypothetical protein